MTLLEKQHENREKIKIPIKGFQKTSLLDFPSKISSIIFIGGCNFRCNYCYNPDLVDINSIPNLHIIEVLEELNTRRKYIDGVVITGGEPTLYPDLPLLIKEIKDLNLLVKLDTNGTNPPLVRELINKNLVDYIAVDIKAPAEKYYTIVGKKVNINLIKETVEILINSKIDYEFRTTLIKEDHPEQDILIMADWIKGAKKYCLQQFRSNTKLVNNLYKVKTCYSKQEMEDFKEQIKGNFDEVELRLN
tara:strand:- start:28671 stop:29411 length:741 start_codon:yes stop_codon:yes gene_type:complete